MNKRIIFRNADDTVIRTVINLPKIDAPDFLEFRGKLYRRTGCGMTADFYKEVSSFVVVTNDKDYTAEDFYTVVVGEKESVVIKPTEGLFG